MGTRASWARRTRTAVPSLCSRSAWNTHTVWGWPFSNMRRICEAGERPGSKVYCSTRRRRFQAIRTATWSAPREPALMITDPGGSVRNSRSMASLSVQFRAPHTSTRRGGS